MNKIGAASPVTSVPIASPLLVSSISPLCLFHGISRSQIWLVVVLLYRSCVLFLYIASLLSSPWAWENQYLSFFFGMVYRTQFMLILGLVIGLTTLTTGRDSVACIPERGSWAATSWHGSPVQDLCTSAAASLASAPLREWPCMAQRQTHTSWRHRMGLPSKNVDFTTKSGKPTKRIKHEGISEINWRFKQPLWG